ncbi:MAG: MG2 domain-containing protein, partial [Bacteroidota bacterium]
MAKPSKEALPDGSKTKNNLFNFSPSLNGSIIWKDQQTIIFEPDEWLKPGTEYTAEISLDKIIDVPKERASFVFKFLTHDLSSKVSNVQLNYYQPNDLTSLQISGDVRLTDIAIAKEIEESIVFTNLPDNAKVTWTHKESLKKSTFFLDSITRSNKELIVGFEPSSSDIKLNQTEEITIPSLDDFKLVSTEVIQEPEQEIILTYSDPLNPDQNIEDFIELRGVSGMRTMINGNNIRIFPPNKLNGEKDLTLFAGIQNVLEYESKEELVIPLTFEKVKPAIEWIGDNKNILPSGEGLLIPFKAVALNAVDVKVIKIYEDNVHQFLQVNDLGGSEELRRVGRTVRKKTIDLGQDGKTDLNSWNTYYLDLKSLIETEPGAIYQVKMSFRQAQSVYPCGVNEDVLLEYETWDNHGEDETGEWDKPYSYYWDRFYQRGYYDYDYNERENPCNPTYYRYVPVISRNVLASDIGVVAKSGSDGDWHITTADLNDATPLSGVQLALFNYQEDLLGKTSSDGNGMAVINSVNSSPFLLVASKGNQKGYLKVSKGENLSYSKFDVSGNRNQDGLNGFIYGERGVWRPGDTLFLSFIIQDQHQKLPASHPVKFELRDMKGRLIAKEVRDYNNQELHAFQAVTSPVRSQ